MTPDDDHSNYCCKKAYTIKQAAESAGVSVSTIREAIARDHLVAVYIGLQHTKPLIRSADLDAWLESQPTEKGARW